MTTYYARKEYNYSGGDAIFGIPFDYIRKEHISVSINGEATENYTYLNNSQIRITDTLTVGDVVTIARTTPISSKMVVFSDTSILNKDTQNLAQDQVFDAVQEIYDNNIVFQADVDEQFTDYKTTVDNALNTIDGKADLAISTANGAVTTANSANSKADNAVNTANSANSKANNAVSTANTASSNASTAVNTANTAKNTADTAKETADTTKNRVDEFEEDIEVVIEAAEKIDELEEAVQTAVGAAQTASDKADLASDKADDAIAAADRAEAVIPSQTGHNGQFLQTDGTNTSWETVDALPSQTGQSGKFLTTDGTDASWETITIPTVDTDDITISKNSDDELQTVGVIDQNNTSNAIKTWTGTKAQYDAIATKDSTTLYITDNGLFLGATEISNISGREIGEIIPSTLPLTSASVHLTDGSLLQYGSYKAFIDKIGTIFNNSDKYSNVTKVGALTDVDGVLSGFSASNYAALPQTFNPSSNTWEKFYKFTTGNDVTTSQLIECFSSSSLLGASIILQSGGLIVYLSSNGSSWDIAQYVQLSGTILANTTYYLRVTFNGTQYKYEISTDNETFTTIGTINSTANVMTYPIRLGVNEINASPFLGSIDLNESYINIGGSRWWSGRMALGFTEEANWQAVVNTYGVCGKYVYDETNKTVRLPKITGLIEGTTDLTALGDLIKQYVKLPNITGYISIYNAALASASGAFYRTDSSTTKASGSNTSPYPNISFDASRSSSVYSGNGTDTKIQPQAIKLYFYVVIATITKTNIEVNIDEIATDLNGKCDTDGTNATFPHIIETYINGASGYIIYSNGWCKQWGRQTAQGVYTHAQAFLLKAYKDTNYLIYGTHIAWSSENNSWYTGSGTVGQAAMIDIIGSPSESGNKTTTYFMLPACSSHTWITEGYLW